MPLLFSYGTLREEKTQLALYGRYLEGHSAKLMGYKKVIAPVADPEFARTSGKSHHAILVPSTDPQAEVAGTAFEVSDAELTKTDAYEPAEYERVLAALSSGAQTWVYVAKV